MHTAAIDTSCGRFDAAAECDEHDEDEGDGDVDDVGGGQGRKRKQRKAIASVEKSSRALSTHLTTSMAQLLQWFGTHAGDPSGDVQQMRLASAQATLKDKAFEKMLSELDDVTTKYVDDL